MYFFTHVLYPSTRYNSYPYHTRINSSMVLSISGKPRCFENWDLGAMKLLNLNRCGLNLMNQKYAKWNRISLTLKNFCSLFWKKYNPVRPVHRIWPIVTGLNNLICYFEYHRKCFWPNKRREPSQNIFQIKLYHFISLPSTCR